MTSRRPLTAADLAEMKPPHDFVEGLLFDGCMSLWAGAPKSGKSFLLLDLATAVALGTPWAGRAVDQGNVLLLALEGVGMLYTRVRALELERGVDSPLLFSPQPFNIMDEEAVADIIAMVRKHKIRLVILDTLARAMAGMNDSDFQDSSDAVAALDRIREATGAHVAIVHHTGHDGKRARGSSNWLAAPDLNVLITRTPGAPQRFARITENRNGPEGECLRFTLESRTLDFRSSRGKPITSAIVKLEGDWFEELGPESATAADDARFSEREREALAILETLNKRLGRVGPASIDQWRRELKREEWGPANDGSWRSAFSRLTEKMDVDSNGVIEL